MRIRKLSKTKRIKNKFFLLYKNILKESKQRNINYSSYFLDFFKFSMQSSNFFLNSAKFRASLDCVWESKDFRFDNSACTDLQCVLSLFSWTSSSSARVFSTKASHSDNFESKYDASWDSISASWIFFKNINFEHCKNLNKRIFQL